MIGRHSSNLFSPYADTYALGPLHTSQVTEHTRQLPNGMGYTLLVPNGLPASVLNDPDFWGSCETGYLDYDDVERSPMQLTNWLYRFLHDEVTHPLAGEEYRPYPFAVAFLVGSLSACAETDKDLALVGMAHLLFLLSYLPADATPLTLVRAIRRVDLHHKNALSAYRTSLRALRAQGIEGQAAYQHAYALPQFFLAPYVNVLTSLPQFS